MLYQYHSSYVLIQRLYQRYEGLEIFLTCQLRMTPHHVSDPVLTAWQSYLRQVIQLAPGVLQLVAVTPLVACLGVLPLHKWAWHVDLLLLLVVVGRYVLLMQVVDGDRLVGVHDTMLVI